ncbi:MAG: DM13 domain-containing protein [Candidatus Puniceispirillaceae bacterium]
MPDGVNVDEFPVVVIWCEAFSQFITAAELS